MAIQNKYVPDGTVYGMAPYVIVNVKDMLNLRYRILFIGYSARIFSFHLALAIFSRSWKIHTP